RCLPRQEFVMRTWIRRFTTLIFLLPLVLCLAVATRAASVTTVSYTFSGRVLTVNSGATAATGVVAGDTITGAFAYNSSQTGSNGVYNFTGSSKAHTFSFKIFDSANNQVFADFYSGNLTAFYSAQVLFNTTNPGFGVTGTQLTLSGDTTYKQGLGYTHATN